MNEKQGFTLETEQQAAARTIDRNVSVEAGAGTGKTTTLTERYLTILRVHLDGPDSVVNTTKPEEPPYRVPADIEQITETDDARSLTERIVVTTFTERAAEDLKESIRSKIRDRLDTITDPERWKLWRAAADGVASSYIHTMHGFCNRILQEYAITHQEIDPKFDVLEEDEASLLAANVVTELIESEPDEARTLAPLFDRQKLISVLCDLMSERDMTETWVDEIHKFQNKAEYEAALVSLHPFNGNPETLLSDIEEDLNTLCELLRNNDVYNSIGKQSAKRVGQPLLDWNEGVEHLPPQSTTPFEQLSLCIELCDILTNGDNEGYADGTYFGKKGFRTSTGEIETQYIEAMTGLLETVQPTEQPIDADVTPDRDAYQLLTALASLVQTALERYDQQKRRQGVVDYNDLIRLTIKFLESDSDAVAQLRSDLQYVMVDEFQDTNDRQWRLVKALVSDENQFTPDNVFLVGDTKQSIYRFRDADVTVFDTARTALAKANAENETPDDGPPLITNFRTLPETLSAINGLFDRVFGYGGSEAYEATAGPLRAGRESKSNVGPVVEYIPVPVDSELRTRFLDHDHILYELPESEPADIEATVIATRIARLLNSDTQVSADNTAGGDEATSRKVVPEDVAVLIRSRSDLKDYERALRTASVPYTVIKGEGFFETPEIRSLVSLFRVLADPSNEISLYATLRSPLCGLDDETIARVRDPTGSLWEDIQQAEGAEIRTVATDLKRWREYAGIADSTTISRVDNWVDLADRIFEETGYITAVAADERGVAAVANVDKFSEKLREFDVTGVSSIERVVARLSEQSDQGRTEAEANISDGGRGVRIMTVHEAKGQEFPVVVVPGLSKGFTDRGRISNGSVEFELVQIDDERRPILGLNVPGDWGEKNRGTLMRHIAKERRRAEERAEEKRILYVACTRAEDHLILTGRHTVDEDDPTGVEPADPMEPSSMRDWILPALFGLDDTAVSSWEQLETDGSFTRALRYELDGEASKGTFTVRLPPESGSYDDETEPVIPNTQRSAFEYEQPWEVLVSASVLSRLADGSAKLSRDLQPKRIRTVATDDFDYDVEFESTDTDDSISAAVFGQAVHRLCEMQPPREQWEPFIQQVIREEHASSEDIPNLRDDEFESITTAADRSIAFLDGLHNQTAILQSYDEFPIELSIPGGEISGYIDHLIVTEDSYHIVDYKTDRRREHESIEAFLDRRATHHEPQVMAYAAALQQADPERDVSVTLFFTNVNSKRTWTPEEMHDAYQMTVDQIQSMLPSDVRMQLSK